MEIFRLFLAICVVLAHMGYSENQQMLGSTLAVKAFFVLYILEQNAQNALIITLVVVFSIIIVQLIILLIEKQRRKISYSNP